MTKREKLVKELEQAEKQKDYYWDSYNRSRTSMHNGTNDFYNLKVAREKYYTAKRALEEFDKSKN